MKNRNVFGICLSIMLGLAFAELDDCSENGSAPKGQLDGRDLAPFARRPLFSRPTKRTPLYILPEEDLPLHLLSSRDSQKSCTAVDPKLPKTFVCAADTVCLSLASSTSAICCPVGTPCSSIVPINCDVTLQDPSKYPNQPIMTTNLTGTLPACGSACCPFGYTCGSMGGQPTCNIIASAAVTAQPSSTSATQTGKSTTTSSSSTVKPTASGLDSDNPPPSKRSTFPTGPFVGVLVVVLILTVVGIYVFLACTGRLKRRGANKPMISAPLVNEDNMNERSDFLGRARSKLSIRKGRDTDEDKFWREPTPPANQQPITHFDNAPYVEDVPGGKRRISPSNGSLTHELDEKDFAEPIRGASRGNDSTAGANNPYRPETIKIFSPEFRPTSTSMPQRPAVSVAPLRGMNTRRLTPPADNRMPEMARRDALDAPFRTPEKRAHLVDVRPNQIPSQHLTYHDTDALDSPVSPITSSALTGTSLQTLTPARYDPTDGRAGLPSNRDPQNVIRSLQPSTRPPPPSLPPRPDHLLSPHRAEEADFDFDDGLDSPVRRPAVSPLATPNLVSRRGHDTTQTTFTQMLSAAGFPHTRREQFGAPGVPAVPVLHRKKEGVTDALKRAASGRGKQKGMI